LSYISNMLWPICKSLACPGRRLWPMPHFAVGDATNTQSLENAFSAAVNTGFSLFLSFDYAGNGAWAKDDVLDMLETYKDCVLVASPTAIFIANASIFASKARSISFCQSSTV
jgi:hypothetical protein